MKRFSLVLIAMVAAACSPEEKKETVVSTVFIEQKVNEFVAQNPDWTTAETANEEITDKFQHEIKRLSNEPEFLKDMPLQLKELRDTVLSGTTFKMGTFIGYSDNARPKGTLLNNMQIRIDGILSPNMQKEVKLEGKYHIEGMLYKQGSRKDVKLIHVADFNGYDLGKYLMSITKVTPIQ